MVSVSRKEELKTERDLLLKYYHISLKAKVVKGSGGDEIQLNEPSFYLKRISQIDKILAGRVRARRGIS